jgi:hypothetical protein
LKEFETLYALVEISVALAGFSAIVVLFKRGDSGSWLASDANRFNGMLIHAMSAAFFCILPPLLSVFSTNEAVIWSIASSLLGVQIILHSAVVIWLAKATFLIRSSIFLALGAVVLQFLNVAEIHYSREFRPYLAGVLWHLIQAGVLFVNLIWVRALDTQSE